MNTDIAAVPPLETERLTVCFKRRQRQALPVAIGAFSCLAVLAGGILLAQVVIQPVETAVGVVIVSAIIAGLIWFLIIRPNLRVLLRSNRVGMTIGPEGIRLANTQLLDRIGVIPWPELRALHPRKGFVKLDFADTEWLGGRVSDSVRQRLAEAGLPLTTIRLDLPTEEFVQQIMRYAEKYLPHRNDAKQEEFADEVIKTSLVQSLIP
ncbi:MAG: hypothetical protein LBK28_04560, partial [Propionibacteriaceae bacterium]|nr:hypothetical protein [Propionibacteriaceae bacterium]